MSQLSMSFAPTPIRRIETPLARRTDPSTSHEAAEHVTSKDIRAHQRAQAIATCRAFPGHTSYELSRLSIHDRLMLARRLPDARDTDDGPFVKNTPPGIAASKYREYKRTCAVSGRKAMCWWPV